MTVLLENHSTSRSTDPRGVTAIAEPVGESDSCQAFLDSYLAAVRGVSRAYGSLDEIYEFALHAQESILMASSRVERDREFTRLSDELSGLTLKRKLEEERQDSTIMGL